MISERKQISKPYSSNKAVIFNLCNVSFTARAFELLCNGTVRPYASWKETEAWIWESIKQCKADEVLNAVNIYTTHKTHAYKTLLNVAKQPDGNVNPDTQT